jgi:hypothetical protein
MELEPEEDSNWTDDLDFDDLIETSSQNITKNMLLDIELGQTQLAAQAAQYYEIITNDHPELPEDIVQNMVLQYHLIILELNLLHMQQENREDDDVLP